MDDAEIPAQVKSARDLIDEIHLGLEHLVAVMPKGLGSPDVSAKVGVMELTNAQMEIITLFAKAMLEIGAFLISAEERLELLETTVLGHVVTASFPADLKLVQPPVTED